MPKNLRRTSAAEALITHRSQLLLLAAKLPDEIPEPDWEVHPQLLRSQTEKFQMA